MTSKRKQQKQLSDAIPAIVLKNEFTLDIAQQISRCNLNVTQQISRYGYAVQQVQPFHNAVQGASPGRMVNHDQRSSASEYFFGMYIQKAIFTRNQREGWGKFSLCFEGPMEWSIMVTANKSDFESEWPESDWSKMMATVSKEEFESPWFVQMFETKQSDDGEPIEEEKMKDGVNELIQVKLNPMDQTFELVSLLPAWRDACILWTPCSSCMDNDINNALDALYLQIYTKGGRNGQH